MVKLFFNGANEAPLPYDEDSSKLLLPKSFTRPLPNMDDLPSRSREPCWYSSPSDNIGFEKVIDGVNELAAPETKELTTVGASRIILDLKLLRSLVSKVLSTVDKSV